MKNKLIVNRGEGEGITGGKWVGSSRNMDKGPMDKKGGIGYRVGWGDWGGKWKQLYLNNNKKGSSNVSIIQNVFPLAWQCLKFHFSLHNRKKYKFLAKIMQGGQLANYSSTLNA